MLKKSGEVLMQFFEGTYPPQNVTKVISKRLETPTEMRVLFDETGCPNGLWTFR